jgi:hypothetical protein
MKPAMLSDGDLDRIAMEDDSDERHARLLTWGSIIAIGVAEIIAAIGVINAWWSA